VKTREQTTPSQSQSSTKNYGSSCTTHSFLKLFINDVDTEVSPSVAPSVALSVALSVYHYIGGTVGGTCRRTDGTDRGPRIIIIIIIVVVDTTTTIIIHIVIGVWWRQNPRPIVPTQPLQ